MRSVRWIALAVAIVGSSIVIAPAGTGRAPDPNRIEPGVLDVSRSQDVLIRFAEEVPSEITSLAGLDIHYRFGSVPALSATATPEALRVVAAHPGLAYLEADKPIEFDLDTATIASRSKDVVDPAFDPSTPAITGPGGETIDGTGVGIAIVDTGLDGLHPDFQAEGKVKANYLLLPTGPVSMPNTAFTSTDSGHGTHVAGIAAGTGALSAERGGPVYEGVAPGASLYAFNVVAGDAVSAAVIAFDWIIMFGAQQDPPIRIVNNSWHCGATACRGLPGERPLHIELASAMAEAGLVVTWAAGNDQGDGFSPTTSPEARNQTPGIISVANYKDNNWGDPALPDGTRDACLSSNSAWGASTDPTTWPDLSAPGRSISSTWAFGVDRTGTAGLDYRDPVTNENAYKSLSGTSMAAPHVAGIAALMLQANPTLSPAEIEYILKQTATPLVGPADEDGCGIDYIRADASHPWTGSNYAAGHGLVHAYDAVDVAVDFSEIPALIPTEAIPEDFVVVRPGIQADKILFLSGDGSLSETYPEAATPRAQPQEPNTALTFRSDPFDEPLEVDALIVSPYIGTTGEAFASLTPPRVRVTVEREMPGGARQVIASKQDGFWQIYAGQPVNREMQVQLDEPVTFDAGDRARLKVEVVSPPLQGIDPPPEAFWILYWERPFASRLELGHYDASPALDSRASCESRQDCAMLDDTHVYETMDCGPTIYDLSWYGPPGSMLIFSCETAHTACVVPGVPGDPWGSCEVEYAATALRTYKAGVCMYQMPDGSRGGSGKCVGREIFEDDD